MSQSLYNKCLKFNKLATKISIKENTNPVLEELSNIKDFADRIKFAEKKAGWKKLGEGSSRTAFQINEHLIIKIAHNLKGIAQNKCEMQPEVQRECVNCCLVADAQGKWIIFRDTEDLTEKEFKEKIGFTFDTFMNSLFYAMNNESDSFKEPREFDKIKHLPLFRCLTDLVIDAQLLIGDIAKVSSFGTVDGKIVLRDAGLDKKNFQQYYKDSDSSSSSSTPKTSEK